MSSSKKRRPAVYAIVHLESGKMYVGSTVNWLHRLNQHFSDLGKRKHQNKSIQDDYDICGKHGFSFYILEFLKSSVEQLLIEREQHWIDKLNPAYNVNQKAGRHIDGYIRSPEAKLKRRQTMLGRKRSKESRERQSKSMLIYYQTHKKIISDEQKKKLSELNTGKNNPNWGKQRSPESRQRTSDAVSKIKVRLLSPSGIEYSVDKLGQFCRKLELNYFAIRRVAIGYRKSYKGWTKVPADAGTNQNP